MRIVHILEELTDGFDSVTLIEAAEIVAAATAQGRQEVIAALRPSGRLVSSGLVEIPEDKGCIHYKLQVRDKLVDLVTRPALDRAAVLEALLPTAPAPTLEPDDYRHIGAEVALARQLLGEALRQHSKGVNLLFYGPTGTGKTELARLLARDNDATLHIVGKADEDGESPSPSERLASVLLGNRLLVSGRSLLLFDEVEDIFERSVALGFGHRLDRSPSSKQWINLLLETNAVPTIWIGNSIEGMDPAYRRRFAYAIEFKPLGPAERRRVWSRHLGKGADLPKADIERLADRFTVNAGQIGTVVAAARLVDGGEVKRTTIEQLAAPLEKLVTGTAPRSRPSEDRPYLFEAANTSLDLRDLTERLVRFSPAESGISICLYGAPGTGKSEFVHHLGRKMGRRVIVKQVSDILSMWVGEAERHIAEAFAEAEREGAILLFDEADSFLRDRRGAVRSWEVTQVNEFLEQLEAHRGIVACTTNLFHDLDQASLRRFTFKIAFHYLDVQRSIVLFRAMLAPFTAEPVDDVALGRELRRMTNLAPGDFAAVARRLSALRATREQTSIASLLAELRVEVGVKEGCARAAGF